MNQKIVKAIFVGIVSIIGLGVLFLAAAGIAENVFHKKVELSSELIRSLYIGLPLILMFGTIFLSAGFYKEKKIIALILSILIGGIAIYISLFPFFL